MQQAKNRKSQSSFCLKISTWKVHTVLIVLQVGPIGSHHFSICLTQLPFTFVNDQRPCAPAYTIHNSMQTASLLSSFHSHYHVPSTGSCIDIKTVYFSFLLSIMHYTIPSDFLFLTSFWPKRSYSHPSFPTQQLVFKAVRVKRLVPLSSCRFFIWNIKVPFLKSNMVIKGLE